LEEPPTDLPLADVKTGHSLVEANIGEPVEVSKEHSSEEINNGEPVEVSNELLSVKEPLEGSKLNGGCEELVICNDAADNDQITEEKAVNQVPKKTHDNQVHDY